ncbi:MAG: thioredoxin fold domain-containing protein, partial [Bacteroidales bacterium]|nr:thioredoxin fold domain-containing protein [Bacteroidales bacterium]
ADYRTTWKYKGDKPCVVDFYADWCRPCKEMYPTLVKMAELYAGKVDFYTIDVDSNSEISDAYNIRGIPTLFFCSSKGELTRIAGLLSEEEIKIIIEKLVAE